MLISIVIPVYNVGIKLHRCIKSVLLQTYSNWELILIDDGSTDESGLICDKYAESDSRIKVIHVLNGGVSRARNLGLDYSSGDWITFSDSDDELFPNALKSYASNFVDGIDLIRAGFERIKNDETFVISAKNIIITDKEQVICACAETGYEAYLWNSCFRREIVARIRFREDISWCEDHLFTFSAIEFAHKIAFIPDLVYRYYAPIVNIKSFGQNLSSRYIEPQMIIAEAYDEWKIKKSYLSPNSLLAIDLINRELDYKMRFALRYAIIGNHFIEAFRISCKYLRNDFYLLFTYFFYIKVIPLVYRKK